jgi:hypothetical protein
MEERTYAELGARLPRMMIPLYVGIVMALQGGYWLTNDGFGLAPHLPILFSVVACILMLRHGLTASAWVLRPRRYALTHVTVIAALLCGAALINLSAARVEAAGKIASCFALAVPLFYTWFFTRAVFRIADRESPSAA